MTNGEAARAVLFDFDGTLAPNLDLPDMRRQVIDLTTTYAVPEPVYDGRYIVEIIDAAAVWLREQGAAGADSYEEQAHRLITDFELNAARDTDPFPGIETTLNDLADAGWRLGVVTRNCRAAVLEVFPHLLDHVDVLMARDDVTHLKPDPRHLQSCLQALGCGSREAVMVGDGQLDMRSGRELDMHCIGVLTGSGSSDSLLAAGAHRIITRCTELSL